MVSLTNQGLGLRIVMCPVLDWHPRKESSKSQACPVSVKVAGHQPEEQK